jgi:hypothetical protein
LRFSILGLCEIKPDLLSRNIMRFIKADFSHIAILTEDGWVYHATGKGFRRLAAAEVLDEKHRIAARADFEIEDHRYTKGWLDRAIGTEYSRMQYLGFLLPWGWVRKLVGNGKGSTICSEVAADFIEECLGYDCGLVENDFLSPRDVMEVALQLSAVNAKQGEQHEGH